MTRFASIIVALVALAFTLRAQADELALEVVDVAGDHAYVVPGEAAGLRSGDTVRFGGRSFEVTTVYAQGAALELRGQTLRRGGRRRRGVKSLRPAPCKRERAEVARGHRD